jgi:hypothetical protein
MAGLRCATDSVFPVSVECAARAVGAFMIVIRNQLSARIAGTITEQRRLSRQKSMRLRRGSDVV